MGSRPARARPDRPPPPKSQVSSQNLNFPHCHPERTRRIPAQRIILSTQCQLSQIQTSAARSPSVSATTTNSAFMTSTSASRRLSPLSLSQPANSTQLRTNERKCPQKNLQQSPSPLRMFSRASLPSRSKTSPTPLPLLSSFAKTSATALAASSTSKDASRSSSASEILMPT